MTCDGPARLGCGIDNSSTARRLLARRAATVATAHAIAAATSAPESAARNVRRSPYPLSCASPRSCGHLWRTSVEGEGGGAKAGKGVGGTRGKREGIDLFTENIEGESEDK